MTWYSTFRIIVRRIIIDKLDIIHIIMVILWLVLYYKGFCLKKLDNFNRILGLWYWMGWTENIMCWKRIWVSLQTFLPQKKNRERERAISNLLILFILSWIEVQKCKSLSMLIFLFTKFEPKILLIKNKYQTT